MELMNAKQLMRKLHISTTLFYKWKRMGLPSHQLPGTRAYYLLEEVEDWLKVTGFQKVETWTKGRA